MYLFHIQQWKWVRAIAFMATILAVSALVGCSNAGQSLTAPQAAIAPTGTPFATPINPTPTLNYKELAFAHVDATVAAERTAFALSGIPTWTPGRPPPYTGPTETPRLGMLPGCASTNSLEPYMISCWVGVYNGDIVNVSSGREGRAGDMSQGVVDIYNRNTHDLQLIRTPDKVGAVQITSIDGTLFTLAAVDHQPVITYTFDLATLGWVNP